MSNLGLKDYIQTSREAGKSNEEIIKDFSKMFSVEQSWTPSYSESVLISTTKIEKVDALIVYIENNRNNGASDKNIIKDLLSREEKQDIYAAYVFLLDKNGNKIIPFFTRLFFGLRPLSLYGKGPYLLGIRQLIYGNFIGSLYEGSNPEDSFKKQMTYIKLNPIKSLAIIIIFCLIFVVVLYFFFFLQNKYHLNRFYIKKF